MREQKDHYFREAKREGYVSRAAYKLIEIDERKQILKRGDFVVDCGCAPGSWLQVAVKRIGPRGLVVGIDLQKITHQFREENVRTVQGNLCEIGANELLKLAEAGPDDHREERSDSKRFFDVILSDMAPNTSGNRTADHFKSIELCDAVLNRCGGLLKPGGKLVMKVFEGEAYRDLLSRVQPMFDLVKGFVPKASRSESTEIYIVSSGFKTHT